MRSFYMKTMASLGLLAALGLSNSAEGFVAGAKATGMAATGIAYPQDAFAGAYNPAGIVDVTDRLDFGFDWIQDRGHIRGRDNRSAPGGQLNPFVNRQQDAFKTKDTYNGDFGINKTFCTEVCGNCLNFAVGLVGYNRDYQKTTYTSPLVLLGTTNAGLEYLHETFAPVFAFRINDCHSIGVSVDVQVQRTKVNGLQNFDNPVTSSHPGHVTNKGYAYAAGVGATIGWKWQISDYLSVGVTYRTKAKMSKFHKYKGFLAQNGLLNTPQKVGAGIAWKFLHCATIAFDFEWIDWHDVRALSNPLINSRAPLTPPFITKLGTKYGPGFGFRDQYFYRVGIDYQINDQFIVRAGFRHANSPVRRSQTAVNVLTVDTVEDIITVGATYTYNCRAEISIFYAYGFSNKIRGKNSIPAFLGGGNIDLVESKDALGISVGYMF